MHFRFRWFMILSLLLLVFVPAALAQDGSFGLSPEDFELFSAANAASTVSDSLAFDFSVSFSSADAALELTGTGLVGTDASGEALALITFSGSADVPDEFTGELVADQPVDVEIRIVGNMMYVNDKTGDEGWQGASLDDALSEIAGSSGLPVDPADLAAGDISGLTGDMDMMALFGGVEELLATNFIVMSRLADEGSLAHFNTSINVAAITEAPSLLTSLLTAGGMVQGSGEEAAQQAQFFAAALKPILEGISINFDQYIDSATSLVQRGVLAIDLTIPSLTGEGEPLALTLNVGIDITDYAPVVAVEAPAEYTEVSNE